MASATIVLTDDEGNVDIVVSFSNPGLDIKHGSHVTALAMIQFARGTGNDEEAQQNG